VATTYIKPYCYTYVAFLCDALWLYNLL
jgi:hypothetical protein